MKKILALITLLCVATFATAQRGEQGILTQTAASGGTPPSNFAYITASVTGCYTNATTTKCVYALHQTPGAGHLLILLSGWSSATATMSCTDPNNGTWTAIGSPKVGAGDLTGFRGQMFYVAAAVNAATTVTCTASTSLANMWWEAAEYSYTGTISGFDGTPQYSNTAAVAGTATISGVTTIDSSDLVWGACIVVDSNCGAGSGSTYTFRDDAASCSYSGTTCTTTNTSLNGIVGPLVAEKVNVAAAGQVITFSAGTTDNVILGIVAF